MIMKSNYKLKTKLIMRMTVVVKRQAEEVRKRVQDKLRVQGNYKHKTRALLKKRAQK